MLKIKIYEFSPVSANNKNPQNEDCTVFCGFFMKVVGGFFLSSIGKGYYRYLEKSRLKTSQLVSLTHPLPGHCTIPINCIIARFSYIPGGCLIPFLEQMFEKRKK
jgi:hypothetical protein